MRTMSRTQILMAGILICALFAGGCASSKTYLFNIQYEPNPPVLVKSSAKPVTVALYMFQDTRPDRVYLGQRLYPDGMVDYYKPENQSIEQIVTQAIAQNLEKAGFRVKMIHRYLDSKKEDFQEIPADAALGGRIDSFWVEAKKSGYTTWNTNAKMRLEISWGLPKERTWITKYIEGEAQEADRPLYKAQNAQTKINEVFRDVIDKLLKDETVLQEKLLKG
jgi:uncharacterized lipoprotein YajG